MTLVCMHRPRPRTQHFPLMTGGKLGSRTNVPLAATVASSFLLSLCPPPILIWRLTQWQILYVSPLPLESYGKAELELFTPYTVLELSESRPLHEGAALEHCYCWSHVCVSVVCSPWKSWSCHFLYVCLPLD